VNAILDLLNGTGIKSGPNKGNAMTTQLLASSGLSLSPLMPDSPSHAKEPHRKRGTFTGLTKPEAEAVLDWLEAHGHCDCQVSYVDGECFTVTE